MHADAAHQDLCEPTRSPWPRSRAGGILMPDGFALLDERVYGAARLVFLRRGNE